VHVPILASTDFGSGVEDAWSSVATFVPRLWAFRDVGARRDTGTRRHGLHDEVVEAGAPALDPVVVL
jgi:hypothetical protein